MELSLPVQQRLKIARLLEEEEMDSGRSISQVELSQRLLRQQVRLLEGVWGIQLMEEKERYI